MGLYSLHASIEAVLKYLEKVDPEASRRALLRYSCFDHFSRKPQEYGYATTVGAIESCENAVVEQLVELQQKAAEFLSRDGEVAAEEFFFAEQNACLVKDAEQYYRAMFRGRASSWNLRDRHMVETLENLIAHLNGSRQSKAIVWAHNSHLGDARQIGVLQQRRIERAIGVIYRPESERLSHYFHARLPEQFDAIIHIDETQAVEPLERTSIWEEGELPETYPFKV